MSRSFDARRLDVAALAEAGASLSGTDALQNYERLALEAQGADKDLTVEWNVQGGRRQAVDGQWRPSLHLQARARLPLTCQRCLGPVATPLVVDRHLVFVESEARAAALDDASDDDVLALTPALDLRELIEDELLLALPLVPRHEVCPDAVRLSAHSEGFDAAQPQRPHPFAALAALKQGGKGR